LPAAELQLEARAFVDLKRGASEMAYELGCRKPDELAPRGGLDDRCGLRDLRCWLASGAAGENEGEDED
jgi:hypothetical protein